MPRSIPLALCLLALIAPAAQATSSHVDGRCSRGATAFSQTDAGGPASSSLFRCAPGRGCPSRSYAVESANETTAQMAAARHRVIQSVHSFGADGDGAFAYYDTAETLGSSSRRSSRRSLLPVARRPAQSRAG